MKIILFGATGMVGQGVLRECLLDPAVKQVIAIVRKPMGESHPKLHERVHGDFLDFGALAPDFVGADACFFCLGVSSAGMSEKDYRVVTHDFTLAAAEVLARQSPGMTFIYVSGAGTDSSEKGRSMWARVKGQTENALLKLPFKAAYMFRPGFIQPLHGIRSKTRIYRVVYSLMGPLIPVVRRLFPRFVITTEQLGRAMIAVARHGAPRTLLENQDLAALSG